MKNEHKIKVTLEGSEWETILNNVFKKKNKNVTIPGFRKGKAPKDKYIKAYGIESLYMDAVDDALNVAYKKALDDNNLIPYCEPSVDITGIDEHHVDLEFKIITKPEVKVSSYKNLGIKKPKAEIDKESIEEEIKHMQEHLAEIIVKDNGEVADGDIAVIDFEGFVDGEAFEGGKGSDYPLTIGSNTFIPGFEEQLIGHKKDETVDVNVKFPEEYVENLKGKDALFKVTIKEIRTRVLPAVDENFFKDLGYDDVKTKEELEEKIKEHLLMHEEERIENTYIDDLLEAGIKNVEVEINDEIIEEEIKRIKKEIANRLQMQGISLEDYFKMTGTTEETFTENSKPQAIDHVKTRLLLDYIIEKEGLTVTEEEAKEHAKEQAEKYGVETDELIGNYGGLDVVKYDLLIHKAIKVLES